MLHLWLQDMDSAFPWSFKGIFEATTSCDLLIMSMPDVVADRFWWQILDMW